MQEPAEVELGTAAQFPAIGGAAVPIVDERAGICRERPPVGDDIQLISSAQGQGVPSLESGIIEWNAVELRAQARAFEGP